MNRFDKLAWLRGLVETPKPAEQEPECDCQPETEKVHGKTYPKHQPACALIVWRWERIAYAEACRRIDKMARASATALLQAVKALEDIAENPIPERYQGEANRGKLLVYYERRARHAIADFIALVEEGK